MPPERRDASVRAAFRVYLSGAGAGLAAKALSLVAGFGNLWLLTQILPKEQFAGYVFVFALLTWLAMVGTAGLDRTVLFRLARHDAAPGELVGGSLVAAALLGVVPISAVLAAIVAFGTPATGAVSLPNLPLWLALLAPLLVTTCVGRIFESWFMARGRVGPAVLVPAVGEIARTVALALAFVAFPTPAGVAGAVTAAAMVPPIIWLALAPVRTLRRPERIPRSELTYGVQAMLGKATNEGAHQVDVILIGVLATAAATADYAVAARLAVLVGIGKKLLTPVLTPRLAQHSARGAREALAQEYRQVQLVGLLVALVAAAAVVAFGRPLLGTFDDYERSYPLLVILVVGYVVNAGFGANAAFLNVSGYAGWTLAARLFLLAAIVGLNLALIPALGALGAALSMAIGMTAVNALLSAIIWRVDRLPTMTIGLLAALGAAAAVLLLAGLELLSPALAAGGLLLVAGTLSVSQLAAGQIRLPTRLRQSGAHPRPTGPECGAQRPS